MSDSLNSLKYPWTMVWFKSSRTELSSVTLNCSEFYPSENVTWTKQVTINGDETLLNDTNLTKTIKPNTSCNGKYDGFYTCSGKRKDEFNWWMKSFRFQLLSKNFFQNETDNESGSSLTIWDGKKFDDTLTNSCDYMQLVCSQSVRYYENIKFKMIQDTINGKKNLFSSHQVYSVESWPVANYSNIPMTFHSGPYRLDLQFSSYLLDNCDSKFYFSARLTLPLVKNEETFRCEFHFDSSTKFVDLIAKPQLHDLHIIIIPSASALFILLSILAYFTWRASWSIQRTFYLMTKKTQTRGNRRCINDLFIIYPDVEDKVGFSWGNKINYSMSDNRRIYDMRLENIIGEEEDSSIFEILLSSRWTVYISTEESLSNPRYIRLLRQLINMYFTGTSVNVLFIFLGNCNADSLRTHLRAHPINHNIYKNCKTYLRQYERQRVFVVKDIKDPLNQQQCFDWIRSFIK